MQKKITRGMKSKKVKEAERNLKREMKKQKLEARRMRWYGNPHLNALAEEDPGVRPYYHSYLFKKEAIQADWAMAILFLIVGGVEIFTSIFTLTDFGVGISFNFLLSLYWFLSVRIEENACDLLRHEIVQYADGEAALRAYKRVSGEKLEEKVYGEKVD